MQDCKCFKHSVYSVNQHPKKLVFRIRTVLETDPDRTKGFICLSLFWTKKTGLIWDTLFFKHIYVKPGYFSILKGTNLDPDPVLVVRIWIQTLKGLNPIESRSATLQKTSNLTKSDCPVYLGHNPTKFSTAPSHIKRQILRNNLVKNLNRECIKYIRVQ